LILCTDPLFSTDATRGKAAGLFYLEAVPVNAIGLDWMIELGFARDHIQTRRCIQGNLELNADPSG
jgi:uroporphyrinogen-III decarboxylase